MQDEPSKGDRGDDRFARLADRFFGKSARELTADDLNALAAEYQRRAEEAGRLRRVWEGS